jgi:hypothetical protein
MWFHFYSSLGVYTGSELLSRRFLGAQYWAVDSLSFPPYWKSRSIRLIEGEVDKTKHR